MLHTFVADQNRKRLCVKIPYGPEIESKSIGKYVNLESAWALYLQEIGSAHFQKFLKLCFTSKQDRAYALMLLIDRKMNPKEPESMQISNPLGDHIYKKSEARILKNFKIVLHI